MESHVLKGLIIFVGVLALSMSADTQVSTQSPSGLDSVDMKAPGKETTENGKEALPDFWDFWEEQPDEELIECMLEEMSNEELLGQVFMLGYTGKEPSPDILDWIENRHLGGVKIFTRNVDTLVTLARSINKMQSAGLRSRFQIPLFMATDQEGGWVRHIKGKTSRTPGNIALGASGLPRDALLTGYYIGQELKTLGINMNFAPTIDVYSNPSANVIGPRSFSSDSQTTALLALAYFKGMSRSGIICTAKHFPGHGHTDKDSHGALPVVRISFEEMWERELVPYRILIREGLPAIMTGHIAFPEILGRLTPSSLSPFFIEELLREKLKFTGLSVTDDMEMNGVLSENLNTAGACRKALEAGHDMILISHTPRIQDMTWRKLKSYLNTDSDFRMKLKKSVRRILMLKLKTFKGNNPFPIYTDEKTIISRLPADGADGFFNESSMRCVTLIKNGHIPFTPEPDEKILLIGQFQEFLTEGEMRYSQAGTLKFPYSPFYFAEEEYQVSITRKASGYDTIIFCLANYNSLEILNSLKDLEKKIIVISTLTPVYLRKASWVESCLAVYGTDRRSFRAGFAALAGDFIPEGRLPVEFQTDSDGSSQ